MKIIVDIKLIVLLLLICQLRNVSSYYESLPEPDSQSEEINESGSEQRHHHHHHHSHRSSHRHGKNREHEHEHNHEYYHEHDQVSAARNGKDDYDDCDCSCSKCDQPSECCIITCKSCPPQYQPPQSGSSPAQSSLVFVPYPYPLIVPNPVTKSDPTPDATQRSWQDEEVTTTSTTTTTTTSTTPATVPTEPKTYLKSQNDNVMLESVLKSVVDDYSNIIVRTPDKLKNGNNKYMLTSLRRTKPTWMPKFGIVPISDNIAEKLLSQLKGIRGLTRRQSSR